MAVNNKKLGNSFERDFCLIASEYGFWAHRLQDNKNGQPADVIIAKGNQSALVDCKVCDNNVFPLIRMEENQINAMRKWLHCGNIYAAFALKLNDDIRMIDYETLMKLRNLGTKSLDEKDIRRYSLPFAAWKEQF